MKKFVAGIIVGIIIGIILTLGMQYGCRYYLYNIGSHGNKVKIVSVKPDINTPLKAGITYEISVDVEYVLKQDNGSITLVLQRGDAVPAVSSSLGNVVEPISKGNGKVTLKTNITVPNTNSIQIFTPLSIPGEPRTKTVDRQVFKVEGG